MFFSRPLHLFIILLSFQFIKPVSIMRFARFIFSNMNQDGWFWKFFFAEFTFNMFKIVHNWFICFIFFSLIAWWWTLWSLFCQICAVFLKIYKSKYFLNHPKYRYVLHISIKSQLAHQNQLHLLIEWKKNEYLPSSESRTLSENLEAISFLLIF